MFWDVSVTDSSKLSAARAFHLSRKREAVCDRGRSVVGRVRWMLMLLKQGRRPRAGLRRRVVKLGESSLFVTRQYGRRNLLAVHLGRMPLHIDVGDDL